MNVLPRAKSGKGLLACALAEAERIIFSVLVLIGVWRCRATEPEYPNFKTVEAPIGCCSCTLYASSYALFQLSRRPNRVMLDRFALAALSGTLVSPLMIASATMHYMSSLLHGVDANDPTTYIVTTSAVVIAALLSCCLSPRQTTAGDPIQGLHTE